MVTITRFAPSPTGHLHIGGVRTALLNYAYAKGRGGRFLLRVEDTDAARSSEAAARGMLEDLAWLGILWDEGPRVDRLSEPMSDRHDHGSESRATLGGDPRGVGPFFQSERLRIYEEHFRFLLERDLAYPAFETTEELERLRAAAQGRKEAFRYVRGMHAPYDRDEAMRRMEAGEEHVLRFRMPAEPIHVRDEVFGDIEFPVEHVDDFVIRKKDGLPTYHFAVVVDDALMGVTHVLRGPEHLNNTPRHVALQKALGFPTPVYAHMALVVNPDGSKMSKRDKDKAARARCREVGVTSLEDVKGQAASRGTVASLQALSELGEEAFATWLGDKTRQLPTDALRELADVIGITLPEIDVDDFRRSGYLPEVLLNYVALLGWNPGGDVEKFDLAFICEKFDLDRLNKANSKFDRVKLLSFNQDAIAAMSDEEFARRWREWCEMYAPQVVEKLGERFELAARAVKPRAKTLADAAGPVAFALVGDDEIVFDEKAVEKVLRTRGTGVPPVSGADVLRELRAVIEAIEPFEPEQIEAAVKAFAEERGLGMGKVAQPLRVAMTGTTVSPGLGETLALVGKPGALARIDRAST